MEFWLETGWSGLPSNQVVFSSKVLNETHGIVTLPKEIFAGDAAKGVLWEFGSWRQHAPEVELFLDPQKELSNLFHKRTWAASEWFGSLASVMDCPRRTRLPPRSSLAPVLHSHYWIFKFLDQKAAEPEKQTFRQDIIPTQGFCLLVSPGLFFPFSCPSWCQDTSKGPPPAPWLRPCLSSLGLDETPPSPRPFCFAFSKWSISTARAELFI